MTTELTILIIIDYKYLKTLTILHTRIILLYIILNMIKLRWTIQK